ncbi:hypothetical protein WKW77_27200 [Variovorax ureilyticus]|uniref:Uncharacterized protein n=1 Tax=Variovorax ureilyticus TaxID=1836198 RepID=A0ABU8VMA1_9BURK
MRAPSGGRPWKTTSLERPDSKVKGRVLRDAIYNTLPRGGPIAATVRVLD